MSQQLTVHSEAKSLQLEIILSEYLLILPKVGDPLPNFNDIFYFDPSFFSKSHFIFSHIELWTQIPLKGCKSPLGESFLLQRYKDMHEIYNAWECKKKLSISNSWITLTLSHLYIILHAAYTGGGYQPQMESYTTKDWW